MKTLFLTGVAGLAILTGSVAVALAAPSPVGPATKAPAAGPQAGETINLPLMAGYKIGYQVSTADQLMLELIPQAETLETWTTMITEQVFRKLKDTDPAAWSAQLGQRLKTACPGARTQKIADAVENGYRVSVWVMACPLNTVTQKPETFALKAISGKDALYSVQYAYKQAQDPALTNPAMDYLSHVQLCDTRLPDRPCPPPAP